MSKILALTGTLDTIRDETRGQNIDVAELVEALNSRGYGPLLVGPALLTVLPTGAIPGVPAVCALIIIFVSVQILFRKKHPWLPKRLKKFSINREKCLNAIEKMKPYTRKVDAYTYPRFEILIRDSLKPVIAVMSILLSVAIIILGFIPFAAMLPAFGILLLGLGLTARDGLLFVLSFCICLGSLAALPYGISKVLG